jgi:hypothetical protein
MKLIRIKYDNTNQKSVCCRFSEGIGLYELCECNKSKDFVVISYMIDGLEFPIDHLLLDLYNKNPYDFKYEFIK